MCSNRKMNESAVHSGEGNVCSSRGDSIFSVLPTFKAHAKPKKCHLFSGPCSGTENSKSSALVIRLRVRPRSVGQPTTPEGRSPYIYLTSTLHLSLLDQSPIDRLTGSFDTLIAEVILDRSRE